jgi:type IV pilus assembly protein PilB
MLSELNKEDVNIITVEDPVEMNIEGINQVYVNAEIGLTFASALRSILRQDPDIILIGEIRDSETAQIAVRAAITGHLVLSTIHTNDALNTIERLLDMDVERYLLSTALNGIISQKLARTLCPKCKKKRPTTNYEKEIFKRILGKDVDTVYEPVGCDECNRGFRGRIALHEVLFLTDALRELINDENVDKEQLRKAVYTGDTTTLLQDALQKVVDGHTTFKEVYKVVDIDFDLERQIRRDVQLAEKEKAKKEKLEVIDLYDNKDANVKITSKEMKKIKQRAKEAAETKYKKRRVKDNDLIDVFEGMPTTETSDDKKKEKKKEK